MEEFDVTLLPDLDQAEEIEVKDMRLKRFAHIDYVRKADNSLLMASRPKDYYPLFFIPIKSLESQYEEDMEIIRLSHLVRYPDVFTGIQNDAHDK